MVSRSGISSPKEKARGYRSDVQQRNLAWFLPRPKPDHYKGGMPLYAEEWLLQLGGEILGKEDPKILNVFCGMTKSGFRVDLNPEVKPDLLCDVHELSKFHKQKYDIILADPAYSDEENEDLFGSGGKGVKLPRLNYAKWTSECTKLLRKRGLLIVYHKLIMPNPDPNVYTIAKRVFIGNRTLHLPRVAIFFQKK
jgi:hypothetical protein